MKNVFNYGIDYLTVGICIDILHGRVEGVLSQEAKDNILRSKENVSKLIKINKPVYGVNTGIGSLYNISISESDNRKLQTNILKSHSCGVGSPIHKEIAKLMMITKVHSLAFGYSGIAIETLDRIIWHINNSIIPLVPEKGSVGASGDLAPLSHLFLPLIGLGEVYVDNTRTTTINMLKTYDIPPLVLGPKESLALINGTQFILSFAINAIKRLDDSMNLADIIGAMSSEAVMASTAPYEPTLHELRPFKGAKLVAKHLHSFVCGSELSNVVNFDHIQYPYSLRCMPQVHGATRNAWLHLKELTEIEMNSVTDNPIIFSSEKVINGGNFHGQLLALPLDYVTIAAAELGNIADRRCYLLCEGRYGLPKMLTHNAGLNSGLMIAQYTTAALVSENKCLCFPSSADSIPTSLGQEDHVSMGSISGRKLNQVIDNLQIIQAIELLFAAQALDFRRPAKSSTLLEGCHKMVRNHVLFLDEDRIISDDVEILHQLIKEGSFLTEIKKIAIKNNIELGDNEFSLTMLTPN